MNNQRAPRPSSQDIEAQLRLALPSPRPELRERILLRCQAEAQSQRRPTARLSWRSRWPVAAACAVFVLQWLVVSHLDARSEAAIHGRPPAPLWAQATLDGVAGDASSARAARDWPQALQRRAVLLSALMNNSDTPALWSASPTAQSS